MLCSGLLMLIGWGWLIPSGVIIAKLFKHRPNGLWFQAHRVIQTLGLLFALAGWIIALSQFTTLNDVGERTYTHAVMGMVTMCLGLFNPLNAVIRPHAPEMNEDKSTTRFVWESVHKFSGYGAIILAIPTIGLGTTFLRPDNARAFQMAYGIGVGLLLILLCAFGFADGSKYQDEGFEKGKADATDPTDAAPEEVEALAAGGADAVTEEVEAPRE
jgi:hypothetical protein